MDVFSLAAKLTLDSKDYEKNLKKQESGFFSFGNKVKKFVGGVTKAATVLTSAASASIVPFVKNATSAYANFEQLVGGVKTLFKQAAVFVQQDADKAFQTAGMSANKYMETATSFAASLIQGLQGDTVAAAEYANRAIIDMSDNANKMGTDMESIQNAYRGFSKQNFTMLDNLKLGYGGTKTEMERLLKDAEKLTGRKFDISNFADIVDAIHAIQVEMGIAGTTADEAKTTIEGSAKATKAAWENLLVAVSDPKGNVKKATANLVASAKTTASNVLPTIKRAVSGLGDFAAEIAPMIGEYIPDLISEFVPQFFNAGKNLVVGLGKGIMNGVKKLKWPTWNDVRTFASNAWNKLQTGIDSLGGLIFGRNDDGTVKWPTWGDVKTAAVSAWNAIKEKAAELGGLIFGKNADGSVKWPTWEDVKNAAETAWKGITDEAAKLGGLIFGNNTDGSVKWPDITEVTNSFDTWWNETALPAIQDAAVWTLKLFGMPTETAEQIGAIISDWWQGLVATAESALLWVLGLPTMPDPNTAGQELRGVISRWWEAVKTNIGNLCTILFGVSGPEDETGTETAGLISKWWDTLVKPLLGDALNFTLGLFGLPSVESMVQSISDWWNGENGVVAKVQSTLKSLIPTSFFNEVIEESLDSTLGGISGKENVALQLLEKLISMGDASQLAADKQAEWKTTAGELISLFPDLSEVINTDTLEITGNTNEIKDNIKAWSDLARERAIQSAKEKKQQLLIDANSDVVEKQIELQQAIDKYTAEKAGLIDKYNAVLEKFGMEERINPAEDFKTQFNAILDKYSQAGDEYESFLTAFGNAGNMGTILTEITRLQSELERNQAQLQQAMEEYTSWESAIESLFGSASTSAESSQKSVENLNEVINSLPSKKDVYINIHENTLTGTDGSNAKGAWDIPFDNYRAILHRNEMVLTASQARQYREGNAGGNNAAILDAVNSLKAALSGLSIQVGGREFGRAAVRYGGGMMNNYLGVSNKAQMTGYGTR